MNVKVGKEHGIFTLCVDDPAMGSLMGHVYFHERPRPLLDVSLQLNKLNKADADYELPPLKEGQVMSGGDHPAQCAAAKEAEEWLAVRPLSRKEREARLRQQQAEHAPPPPQPAAPPLVFVLDGPALPAVFRPRGHTHEDIDSVFTCARMMAMGISHDTCTDAQEP